MKGVFEKSKSGFLYFHTLGKQTRDETRKSTNEQSSAKSGSSPKFVHRNYPRDVSRKFN